MDEPKEIIERRVILPLAEPELARRHGVVQPKAIILIGPPGTARDILCVSSARGELLHSSKRWTEPPPSADD